MYSKPSLHLNPTLSTKGVHSILQNLGCVCTFNSLLSHSVLSHSLISYFGRILRLCIKWGICDWVGIFCTHVIGAHLWPHTCSIKEFRVWTECLLHRVLVLCTLPGWDARMDGHDEDCCCAVRCMMYVLHGVGHRFTWNWCKAMELSLWSLDAQ
jgi:hypothetical protein